MTIDPNLPVHDVVTFCDSQQYADGSKLVGLILEGPYAGCLAGFCQNGNYLPYKVGIAGENTYKSVTPDQMTVMPVTLQTNAGPIVCKVMVQGKMQVAVIVNRLDRVLETMGVSLSDNWV